MTVEWPLGNGEVVEMEVYAHGADWNAVGGVYIFARPEGPSWVALYVGQTEDFSTRVPAHEKWDRARRLGATAVHALPVREGSSRLALEGRLVRHLAPPLNVQEKGP